LATGKSTQIFLDREPDFTTLHVNGVNSTVQAPLRLVERYARDPWINKEKGTLQTFFLPFFFLNYFSDEILLLFKHIPVKSAKKQL